MSTPLRQEYFGPYKVVRPHGHALGAERFVVLCTRTDTNYGLYRFPPIANHPHRRRVFDGFVALSSLKHAHLLDVESVSYDDRGRLCVVTPYTGNHEGVVTLADLRESRGGRLGQTEAARAIEHLLDASNHAHENGLVHGPIALDEILVDRYGCVQVELYGARASCDLGEHPRSTLISDQIRSIVDIGYTLMTGLGASAERPQASRLVRKLDRGWDAWFDEGLDPIDGFESAQAALNALPTNPHRVEGAPLKTIKRSPVQLGAMLRRLRPEQGAIPGTRELQRSRRR